MSKIIRHPLFSLLLLMGLNTLQSPLYSNVFQELIDAANEAVASSKKPKLLETAILARCEELLAGMQQKKSSNADYPVTQSLRGKYEQIQSADYMVYKWEKYINGKPTKTYEISKIQPADETVNVHDKDGKAVKTDYYKYQGPIEERLTTHHEVATISSWEDALKRTHISSYFSSAGSRNPSVEFMEVQEESFDSTYYTYPPFQYPSLKVTKSPKTNLNDYTIPNDQLDSAIAMVNAIKVNAERALNKIDADSIKPKDVAKQLLDNQGQKSAAEAAAKATAAIESQASKERLERLLKASPLLAALVIGVIGGGITLKHAIPLLLKQKPQVIAEMSFRTPLEKIMGKKLPPAQIEKVIWAPHTGEKVMRFTRRIQRVITKGGELMNMIFYGPPGTGKTMTAKAIARASGAEYMIINGAAFEQLPASKIILELEGVFRLAKTSKKPVIFFWDEADAALGKRGGDKETIESRRLINTFLSNVSDTHNSKLMFILATNLPHSLDDAVLSRFPQAGWIFFDRPELAERAKILRMYLQDFLTPQNLTFGKDVDTAMPHIAEKLSHATGRDLRALARDIYDSMIDADVTTLSPQLIHKVVDETTANKDQLSQYVYGQ